MDGSAAPAGGRTTCPQCRVPLERGPSRVAVDGTCVGSHDSVRCDFCGFFLLTESGFEGMLAAAIELGVAASGGTTPENAGGAAAEPVTPANGKTVQTESM